MTVMIRRTKLMPKGGPGGVAIAALDDKRIYIDRAGSGTASKEVVRTSKIMRTGAGNLTLKAEDDGAVVIFDDATTRTVTLPSTAKNIRFTFIIGTPTAGTGHKVDPAAADKITGNGLALADGVAIECDGASDRAGDVLELEGDGADGWYVTRVIGTWSSE